MGNSSGKEYDIDELQNKIKISAEHLLYGYINKDLKGGSEKIFEKYAHLLKTQKKSTLGDVATANGININDTDTKKEMAEKIVSHIQLRIALVRDIIKSVKYCEVRHNALTRGPVCASDRTVFDRKKCTEWKPVVDMPDKSINGEWYEKLEIFDSIYGGNLETLIAILRYVKDFSHEIGVEELYKITKDVSKIKREMENSCTELYQIMSDVTVQTKEDKEARRAAIAAMHGIEALPS